MIRKPVFYDKLCSICKKYNLEQNTEETWSIQGDDKRIWFINVLISLNTEFICVKKLKIYKKQLITKDVCIVDLNEVESYILKAITTLKKYKSMKKKWALEQDFK